MASRADKKQPGSLVGEKSQTVYSANWKLDVMLLKNLQMLDVSKHRVGHRIAMDQRVVNKRFQTRLHRSKIAHARMTNNKDLLRELLRRDNCTFNTSVGGQDDKYTVKISPGTAASTGKEEEAAAAKESLKYGQGKGVRPAATPVVVVEPASLPEKPTSVRAVYRPGTADTRRGTNRRPPASASVAPKGIGRRPSTAMPATSTSSHQPNSSTSNAAWSGPVAESSPRANSHRASQGKKKSRPQTAMAGLSKDARYSDRPSRLAAAGRSSHLSVPSSPSPSVGQDDGRDPSRTPGHQPRPTSAASASPSPRRRSPSQTGKTKHAMPSIFGEDKRPTLLDVNRERLRRADFPARVRSFAGTLRGLGTEPEQTVDYYTLRLLENLHQHRRGPRVFVENEAERRDARRSVGNLSALNMTFGDVSRAVADPLGEEAAGGGDGGGGSPVRARLRAWEDDVGNSDADDNNRDS